jgi:allantoinase
MDADQLDLTITGHVVTPGRVLEDGWMGVRGEIVAGVGPAAPAARQVIDARGQWVLPGVVDAHVHCFSEPAEDDIAVCLTAAVIRLDEELTPGPWP